MSDPAPMIPPPSTRSVRAGLCYGLGAYFAWGMFPIYFKTVAALPEHDPTLAHPVAAWELLAHRIVWAIPVLVALIAWRKRWGEVGAIFRQPGTLATLCLTASLVAFNWLLYIWAVTSGHIVEASLGYFINPLVNVLYGVLFFKDRLSTIQKIGLAMAVSGVVFMTISEGRPPWISLGLAFSFATYGLLRKRTTARPIPGLLVETIVLLPVAGGYLIYLWATGESAFLSGSWRADALLLLAGALTITPLVWFVEAAKRLTLSTIGFLQYIAPSGQFLLGVLVYGEKFTLPRAVAFTAIWVALGLYSVGLVRSIRRRSRSEKAPAVAG